MSDKLREAAQAALEALETVALDAKTTPNAYEATRKATVELRAALDEAPIQEWRTRLFSEAEQQDAGPVDDVWFEDRNGASRKLPKDCQRFGANGVPEAVWVNGNRYTRRPWVSLTKNERQQLLETTHPDSRWTLAERVEAALKEKNT